jgi:catalase-peroxidase
VGPEPEAAKIEQQGFGWANKFKSGKGEFAITSGLEGAWTTEPTKWDNGYFTNLFKYEWKLTKSPAGAHQWTPKDESAKGTVPDAHNPEKKHAPVMFTTDLALKMDPAYAVISKRFHDNPDQFKEAFAKAWYKLTHRDMGPRERCLGKKVPEAQIWQDPVPKGKDLSASEVKDLKGKIMGSGLSIGQLVRTAWASASTFRGTDFRGGANGARIRLAPQKDWAANDPTELAEVLTKLEGLKGSASLADAIVLGGCAAIEEAAKKGGNAVQVAFTGGRGDASAEQTDADSFAVLEPTADGFRNYKSTPHQLVDRAHFLNLTAPEMSVLVAGLRVLDANAGGSQVGVLTKNPGTLSNDFFVNLCDMDTTWKSAKEERFVYEGRDAAGELKWKASQVDLVFGSNSELRAIAEYYACDDSKQAFATDFAAAWTKVMNLDRF